MISLCCPAVNIPRAESSGLTMSMRFFSPHNSPTNEAQRISLKTCDAALLLLGIKRNKRKQGQRYSCSWGQVSILGFALCFQNLSESVRICQESVRICQESVRIQWFPQENFSREHLKPLLWHCIWSNQTPELLPAFPGIALSFSKSKSVLRPWISG